ncbi:nucleotidyltransferase domain-containing protein [Candidatus Pacearchaeota archaeon]|nr:nucleotidyltransferase domain-containing protein [Candidatus Pacearchaeota archaeon]
MYNIVLKMNKDKEEQKSMFGKGKEKIIECFYKNRNKEFYFSEILRFTGLTQNTTLKHLANLQKLGLVISSKQIGNTFYKINVKNPLIYAIFSYFDYKRFNELPFERKRAILEFLDKIEVKPLIILIFGSTAKGTFGKDSDIDLLLIYNKKELVNSKIKEDIGATSGVKIQTFIIELDYLKEQILKGKDSVITHAIKTGFPVTGNDKFYREVLND